MKHRLQFTAKKLLRMALLLLGVSLAAFLLMCASPLDPLQTNVGQTALGSMSQEQVEKLEEFWGVDTPPAERYLGWLQGRAAWRFRNVAALPPAGPDRDRTAAGQFLLADARCMDHLRRAGPCAGSHCGGVPGTVAGPVDPGILSAHIQHACLLAGDPAPSHFFCMAGVAPGGAVRPGGGGCGGGHSGGPAPPCRASRPHTEHNRVANIALHTREKMADVLESDYVLFARARGESERSILLRHGLRNVALPAITLQFGSISEIIGGSVLVEQVFSYPGLGQAARHGRAWERPSAAAGDHGHHLRHRVRRQSDRRSALRSGRPEDPKEGCRTMRREKQHLEKRFSGNRYSENRRQSTILFLIAAAVILAAVTVSGSCWRKPAWRLISQGEI